MTTRRKIKKPKIDKRYFFKCGHSRKNFQFKKSRPRVCPTCGGPLLRIEIKCPECGEWKPIKLKAGNQKRCDDCIAKSKDGDPMQIIIYSFGLPKEIYPG